MKKIFSLAFLLTCGSHAAFGQSPVAGSSQISPDPRDLTTPDIPGVVAAGAKLQLLRGGFVNVEGVISMHDGSVLFCEQDANKIHRIDLDGNFSTYLEDTNRTIGLGYDHQGRLIGTQSRQPRVAVLMPARSTLAENSENQPLVKPNDLIIDRQGGIYFTDPAPAPASQAGSSPSLPPARKSLIFYVTPKGKLTILTDYVTAPNGIQLSPDEKMLYATNGDHIVVFDVQRDGSVKNPRRFADVPGDGMAVDNTGRLYVAVNATVKTGIQVISPKGELLGLIPASGRIQSVGFAGKDRKTLYAVGHSTVYRISMQAEGVKGRAK